MTPPTTLYGLGHSRSARCRWTLDELSWPYDYVEDRTLLRSDALRELHPQAKMPAIVINGIAMFASAALCPHLCDASDDKRLLAPPGSRERALHYQWVSFAATEIEGYLWSNAKHTGMYPEAERVPAGSGKNNDEVHAALVVLEAALSRSAYLTGAEFAVTDIIVGWTINWARRMGHLDEYENLSAYVQRLLARPHCALNPE